MPDNTTSISEQEQIIISHFKHLKFRKCDSFYWSASKQEVSYRPAQSAEDLWQLLHETAHATLKHNDFFKDIQLIRHEVEAWHKAKTEIAPIFGVTIDENFIEDQLDSYRDWLHARSRCPSCPQAGIQQTTSTYQCINCLCSWQVNDARLKQLRRTRLQGQNRLESILPAQQLLQ